MSPSRTSTPNDDASATFLLCPGRGSYGREELGTLLDLVTELGSEGAALVAELETMRADLLPDQPGLLELDQSTSFKPAHMLPGMRASPLIYACSVLDARRAMRSCEPVLVGGNSLGFYSALAVSGALTPVDGMRLVATMARLQEDGPKGGQVLWTLLDEEWHVLPERSIDAESVLTAIRAEGHRADVSIRLGGHIVLAGDEPATKLLLERLPRVVLGKREFPFRLPFHGPFHTDLLAEVAARAGHELEDLPMSEPRIPLVDGRGRVWRPMSTDVEALFDYTVGTQVTSTFDLTAALRVALLDYAPRTTRLLAPGTSLRAPLGHVQKMLGLAALIP
ncbi:MAG: ACP S-malonyltransferase [Planctomycetes bacterium]|nr:ACP S-malonyltransferase [Planctomycetota bacterium]